MKYVIHLFGSPQIWLEGQQIQLPRRKSRALLYYLAAHPQPLSREHLLSFFWPDLPRPAAQQTLRTTLHGMRKALEGGLLVEDTDVGLAPGVEVDVRSFDACLSPLSSDGEKLAYALDLYQGDFLADFFLPGTPAFEDWVVIERERLRRLAGRGLAALSRLLESQGDYASALARLDRALAFDPLQEDLQRVSIRLLYLSGDRPGAVRRYDQLRRLLDEEMGVPPMLETRRLYDAIVKDELLAEKIENPAGGRKEFRPSSAKKALATSFQPAAFLPFNLPFTGREEELHILGELFSSPGLALIEGEAGIGKTRLAEEFIHMARALPVAGAAHELEALLPYQPVIDALRSLLARPEWPTLRSGLDLSPVWWAEIVRLLPELSGEPAKSARGSPATQDVLARPEIPAAGESRLWEGIRQFLAALARQRPVLFFLDDIQWADASSLSLLGYLVRQAEGQIYYLAAARSTPPRSPLASLLQGLLRAVRLKRVSLSRLSQEEILQIARRLSPLYAYPLADWLARSSEGNPYVLAELVRYGREQGILRPDGLVDLSALPGSPVVPHTVYSLIQDRLARLSEPARRVLDAAVAMGREFDFEVVTQAAGISESAGLDALDELRAAGLVYALHKGQEAAAGHDPYSFDHSLTMEVAYQEVGEARHRRLHRRVAEALESIYRSRLDSVAALIAFHFAEGNALERAAPYAFRAGQWAAGLAAWKEAIQFYEQSLASGGDGIPRRDILLALGEAQFRAGEMPKASETLRTALGLADPGSPQASHIRLILAQTLLPQARFGETILLMQEVLASALPEFTVQAEFTWGTALSLEGADLEAAAEHLQRAEQQPAAQSSPAYLGQIKFEQGSVAAQQGDLPRAVRLYRESLAYAQQAVKQPNSGEAAIYQLVLAHNNLAYHLHLSSGPAGREEALGYARAGLALAQDRGLLTLQPYLLSTLGEISLAEGDLDTAERSFNDGLALAERLAMPERIAGLTANLGLVERQRGHADLAIHRFSTALAQADSLGTRHLAAQIRLWLVPLLPPAEARRHLTEAHLIAESSGRLRLLEEAIRLESVLGSPQGFAP